MMNFPLSFITIIVLSLLFTLTESIFYPSWNGFQVNELTSTSLTEFSFQTSEWVLSGLNNSTNSSLCGSNNPILGGVGILGSSSTLKRQYTALPTHTAFYFEVILNLIDNFKSTDSFSMKLESTVFLSTSNIASLTPYFLTNSCGSSSYLDTTEFMVMGYMPHTASTMTFQLITSLFQGTNSGAVGIRAASFTFVNDSSITSAAGCFRLQANHFWGFSGECQCGIGYYVQGALCYPCDASCVDCFGASSSKCFACKYGYSYIGTSCIQCSANCATCTGPNANQCVSCKTGFFLQRNGTCTSTCNTPVAYQQNVGTFQVCKTQCSSSQYIYWNQTCLSSCPAPFIPGFADDNYICNQPCSGSNFYFWNGTCLASCPSPLVQAVIGGVSYCFKPCLDTEFYYWNSSCIADCPDPLFNTSYNEVNFCQMPCQSWDFYYPSNNTCQVSCPSPLVQTVYNDIQYCTQPCLDTEFYYSNDTCGATCPTPLVQAFYNNITFCQSPCQSGYFYYWNSTCQSSCDAPLIQTTYNGIIYCQKPCLDSEFYYWNDTCLSSCDSPLIQVTFNDMNYCQTPCQFNEYYYWNNTCLSSCDSPLIQTTFDNTTYCQKPCWDFEFFYWNSTCQSSCPSPFIQITFNDMNYCQTPCQTNEYYYWNNTCLSSCDSPLIQTIFDDVTYCQKPCLDTEFYYYNNTCQSTCPAPLTQITYNDVNYCQKPCQTSEYYYWNNTCSSLCNAPLIQATLNDVVTCKKPCQPAEFYYWNNTCIASCPSPLIQITYDSIDYCQKPCQDSEFYFWNSTCQSTCPAPLLQTTFNGLTYCQKPCPDTYYLYENNTCLPSCSSPFLQQTSPDSIDYCIKPCSNSNDFLYWNNTCLASCPSPLITVTWSQINFCQLPCSTNYLYPNGSCYSSCASPLVPSVTGDLKECVSPCPTSSPYYYDSDGTCKSYCNSPNTTKKVENIQVCYLVIPSQSSLSQSDIEALNQAAATMAAAGTATSAGVAATSVASSGSPNSIVLISLIKMLEYIRYLDINYPPKLQYLLDTQSQSSVSLNFKVELPPKIEDKFTNYTIPEKFAEYKLVSSFFRNYWEALFTLTVLIFVIALSVFFAFLTTQIKFLGTAFATVRDIIKWNLFLMLLCTNMDGVGLFSALLFQNTRLETAWSALDLVICIGMNLLVVFLIFKVPFMIVALQRARRRVFSIVSLDAKETSVTMDVKESKTISNRVEARYENCNILFRNFKRTTFFQHSCMFFILLRIYLFNMIVGYLFKYPLTQASLILLMSVMIILYLSIKRPFKRSFELIKNLAYESVIILVNICVFIFAVLDHKNIEAADLRVRMGNIVIMANMVFNFLALFFIIADVVLRLIRVYQLRKTVPGTGLQYWMGIGQLLIKPEEMEEDEPPLNPKGPGLNPPAKNLLRQRHNINHNINLDMLFVKSSKKNKILLEKTLANSSIPNGSLCNSPQNHSFNSTSNLFDPHSKAALLPSTIASHHQVEFFKLDQGGFSDGEEDFDKRRSMNNQSPRLTHNDSEGLRVNREHTTLILNEPGKPAVNSLLQNKAFGRNNMRRRALSKRKTPALKNREIKTIILNDGITQESNRGSDGLRSSQEIGMEALRNSQEVLIKPQIN